MKRVGNSVKSKEANGEKRQYYIAILVRSIMRLFWIFPIQKNKVFCITSKGKRYCDSPKYITEELLRQYPEEFLIVWAMSEPDVLKRIKNIKVVKAFSIKHFYHYCTAKVIITHSGMPTYMPKRKGQFTINTWHGGGAYKRNIIRSKYRIKMNEYKSSCLDVYMSSCKSFSDLVIPDLAQGYKGEIMPSGMPRNDLFFKANQKEVRQRVRSELRINEEALIILYAPTYRGWFNNFIDAASNVSHDWDIDVKGLCDAAEHRFNRKVVFVFKKHGLDSADQLEEGIDATLYPDTQELLCAADMLISDYSSIIWDFSLMKKPCFLYVPDKDYYLDEDRGVYTPIESWPGIVCETNTALQKAVLEFDEEDFIKKVEKHHKELGSYETGTACEQICKRIARVCNATAS